MKKAVAAFGFVCVLAACGGSGRSEGDVSQESTADSTNRNMADQSPMGDTANMINNRAGSYPADTSNRNGDDSVSGSSPASRSTTPGADSNGTDID